MDHDHHHHHEETSWKKFVPLLAIVSFIVAFTLGQQVINGWSMRTAMLDFMAGFFLIFGAFKVVRLRAFAEAYASYDLLAARSRLYALAYPFVEVALGVAYLLRFELVVVNWITLVLMLVGSVGVAKALLQKRKIECACLGTVFKLPMTKVTLAEDLLMLAMAAWMLFDFTQTTAYTVEYQMKHKEELTVELSFQIKDDWGRSVGDFETVHTKDMHLIGVRRDLREFLHLHPTMAWNGTWTQEVDFPSEGPYQFYADFTPTGGEPQVLSFSMEVGGFTRKDLLYYSDVQEINGYTITYHWPQPVQTGMVEYSLDVQKEGQAVTVEEYLGAMGHSVVIKADTLEYQHVHASEDELSFTAHFEDSGNYAVFTQIQVAGEVLTVPYTIYVDQGPGMEDHDMH